MIWECGYKCKSCKYMKFGGGILGFRYAELMRHTVCPRCGEDLGLGLQGLRRVVVRQKWEGRILKPWTWLRFSVEEKAELPD